MSQKKRLLSIQEKVDIIRAYEKEKVSVRALADRFKIGKTQAAGIIRDKQLLLQKWHSNINVNQKRSFFKPQGAAIDKMCYEWFVKARTKNIPLSGPLIRSKAKEIADQLNYPDFNASSGWLERFKQRHNISFKSVSGEGASVNVDDVNSFLSKLPDIIRGYEAKNIYNADETGLFFRALPDKTYALKGEKCTGGKLAKERVTILHCVNMAGGSEKLLVIGKSARPRAFQRIDIDSLPVTYKSNKKSWMTSDIMSEWLHRFDRKMTAERRQILLFLDNAASHPRELQLRNIKVIFLPPNSTACCQPLDQGIIKNFKTWYRSLILKHVLARMDSVESATALVKSINLLDIVYLIKKAWDKVTPTTIINCFRKAGFNKNQEQLDDFGPEDDLPLSVIADMCKMLNQTGARGVDIDDFLNVDVDLWQEDENLNLSIENSEPPETAEDSDVQVLEEEMDIQLLPNDGNFIKTYKEALKTTKNLKSFSERNGDLAAFEILSNLEVHFDNMITNKLPMRQTTISDFFQLNS